MAADLPTEIKHALLGSGAPAAADVEQRIEHAQEVVKRCGVAKAQGKAVRFVEQNTPLEKVSEQLLEDQAERDTEISTTLPHINFDGGHRKTPRVTDVYASRRKQAADYPRH